MNEPPTARNTVAAMAAITAPVSGASEKVIQRRPTSAMVGSAPAVESTNIATMVAGTVVIVPSPRPGGHSGGAGGGPWPATDAPDPTRSEIPCWGVA